ncbi:MAG TPA: right-handed parallel beta-helix repeat-containing protein, partial [Armatimonadota bacterium]
VVDPNRLGRGITVDGTAGAAQVTIDGLVVQNGQAGGAGGGIWINRSSATLKRVVVQNNLASATGAGNGGGIYAADSDLSLTASQVLSNSSYGSASSASAGGGIFLANTLSAPHEVTLRDNLIQGNNAATDTGEGDGGGIYATSSYVTTDDGEWIYGLTGQISGNTISGNTDGAGVRSLGGGIYLTAGLDVVANTIQDNIAHQAGGGLVIYDGGSRVEQNTFQGNQTLLSTCGTFLCGGGGFYLYSGEEALQVTDNLFSGNSSQSRGGGVMLDSISGSFSANTITGNHGHLAGGGIAVDGTHPSTRFLSNVIAKNSVDAAGKGAGLYITMGGNHYMAYDHTTLAENTGGAAVYDDNGIVHFNNTIVYGNSAGAQFNSTGDPDVGTLVMTKTLWENNAQELVSDVSGAIVDVQRVAGAARFVDPSTGDYRLQDTSAALDQGASNLIQVYGGFPFFLYEEAEYVDRVGNPRSEGLAPDLGAYEKVYDGDLTFSQGLAQTGTLSPGGRVKLHLELANSAASQAAGGGYITL